MVCCSHYPEKVIFNFSSHELTYSEKHILSKGLRFAIPPRQIDYSSCLPEYKLLYRSNTDLSITSEDRKHFKDKLKDIALSSINLNDNCKYENNLSSEELSSLKTVTRNKNVVIQKADKGNTVVIIDKEKYIQGVKNVIPDSSKFIPLNIPPENHINYILNIEKKFWNLFNNFYESNEISKDELLKICLAGSRPGILYGNLKVHKPVFDNMANFRPMLSAINIPGYNLAKLF